MAQLYQVEFKGSRREFFYNSYHHALTLREYVIVQVEQGEDIALLSKKIEPPSNFAPSPKPRSILRPAGEEDRARYEVHQANEVKYKDEIIQTVRRHGLSMKIVDVECQFDGNKITFFFTADHRVDFRALVRELAGRYRTRIELRQIGVRDEARRIGGFGICGLKQCCNGHIREFAPISTQHARDQDLSLNPSKISGNCGRLLCCLRYEVEQYIAVKKMFPKQGNRVTTSQGSGILERVDVMREQAIIRTGEGAIIRVSRNEIESKVQSAKSSSATTATTANSAGSATAANSVDSSLDKPSSSTSSSSVPPPPSAPGS